MAITALVKHRDSTDGVAGTPTTIAGRCPLPIVLDVGSGTTSSHTYTASDGGCGIRFDENQWTGVTYTKATKRLSKAGLASHFSWKKINLRTTSNEWTQSIVDTAEYYYVGANYTLGPPRAIKINGVVAPMGTVGSLADGEWGIENILTHEGAGADADTIYVQIAAGDPDGQASAYVEAVYGDGTHLRLSSALGSISLDWYEVATKFDENTIELVSDPYAGSDPTLSDIIIKQNVSPWTDLEYEYTVTSSKIEACVNQDTRPSAGTTTIDTSKGFGPIWSFVMKEGFGSATIVVTIHDRANVEGPSTTNITVNETTWSGVVTRYLSATGSDGAAGTSAGTAWQNLHTGLNWLRTATAPAELILIAGETIPYGTIPTTWNGITEDRRIRSSVAGTKATVTWNHNTEFIPASGNGGDLRIYDLNLNKTGGGTVISVFLYKINSARGLMMRCSANCGAAAVGVFGWGTGNIPVADSVIFDCILTSSKITAAESEISIYADYTSTSERRSIFGNIINQQSAHSAIRLYATHILTAFNASIVSGNTRSVPCLRLNSDVTNMPTTGYWSSFCNYIKQAATATTAGECWILKETFGGETFDNILQEGDYLENATAATAHTAIDLHRCNNYVSKNNMFVGFTSHYNSGSGGTTARIFNNSAYCGKSTVVQFIKDAGTGSGAFINLKLINNAIALPSSTAGSKLVENDNAFSHGELVQAHANCVDLGTVTTVMDTSFGNAGFTGAGWPTGTHKSLQLNIASSQGKDNDPSFSSFVTLALNSGSQCRGVAFPFATIRHDHRHYLPVSPDTRNDIGAYEFEATADGTEGTPPEMGMPSLAARFRCVGLRRG